MIYLTLLGIAQAALIAFLLHDRRVERRENATERAELLQRIQAPELAVIAHQVGDAPPGPEALDPNDDEAWHASREDMARALEEMSR